MKLTLIIILLTFLFQIPIDITEIKSIVKLIDKNSSHILPESYNDINLYKDTSPENFLHQTTWLTNPVVINMTKYKMENSSKILLEIEGSTADIYSKYYFKDSSPIFIEIKRIDYTNPKWDKNFDSTKSEISILEIAYYHGKIIWSNDTTYTKTLDDRNNQFTNDAKILFDFKN